MAIPEQQLQTWSTQGAQTASATTYSSIKNALEAHDWPPGMTYTVYLQGSYPNRTNIRGDSDVDVVVESNEIFFHDVPPELLSRMNFNDGNYSWREFRTEVKSALTNYYGSAGVRDSSNGKCIKVAGNGNRLNADVVPCSTFRHYVGSRFSAVGITFWTNTGIQIVNYPKLHLENGSRKNYECSERFKPIVRVFKNARNKIENDFPSYFLECVLYNVPKHCFSESLGSSFLEILLFLYKADRDGSLATFQCQNEQQYIFGSEPHQTNLRDGQILISDLLALWNTWS